MRAGDEREYDECFRALFAPVARTVFLIVHDRALAEDVTQEALFRLLRHWRTVSHYESPEGWVRRVAIRIAVREVQRAAARPVKERRLAAVPAYDAVEAQPEVLRAVAELAPMQRAAVVLYYWEDRPVSEIASLLEVTVSTVKQHLFRARHRLAELLGEREEVVGDVG